MYIINNRSGFIFNARNADIIYTSGNRVEAVFGRDADCERIKYTIAECNTPGGAHDMLNKIRCAIISEKHYFEID